MKHGLVANVARFFLLLRGAESGVCPPDTFSMDVATTSDLQTLIQTINCTGKGIFNVTWIDTVPLVETIEVLEGKQLTVTGTTSALADYTTAVIDAGKTTGVFTVYDGSTLNLNTLVLEGGASKNGAAIDARSSSSVNVTDCVFANNMASNGGETMEENNT